MSDTDSDPNVSKLAREVIDELDSGRYGDKFVFNRRQVIALAGAGLSVGALTTLGVDEATAQEAVGQVGTASEPVDVEAATVNAGSVSTEEIAIGNASVREDLGEFESTELVIDDTDINGNLTDYNTLVIFLEAETPSAVTEYELVLNNEESDYTQIYADGTTEIRDGGWKLWGTTSDLFTATYSTISLFENPNGRLGISQNHLLRGTPTRFEDILDSGGTNGPRFGFDEINIRNGASANMKMQLLGVKK